MLDNSSCDSCPFFRGSEDCIEYCYTVGCVNDDDDE